MELSKAIEGFVIHKTAEGKSPFTLRDYQRHLDTFCTFLCDPQIEQITATDLRRFLTYLRTDYTPGRLGGDKRPLAPKTLRNYWITLRSFFSWAITELEIPDPMVHIKPPECKLPIIEPLTSEEIKAILAACKRTQKAETVGRRAFTMERPTALRDQALILLLLDTGLRASECARLYCQDVDLKTGAVTVRPHQSSRKPRPRLVYLGSSTRRALWRYLASRDDREAMQPNHGRGGQRAALFLAGNGKPMSRNAIHQICRRLGERAGITKPVYPHRFRHTFALAYLRNGGDIYALQRQLGHASLEMVRRYLAIAQADVEDAHRRASPVDNWNL